MTRGDLCAVARETKLMFLVGKHLDDLEFHLSGEIKPNSVVMETLDPKVIMMDAVGKALVAA